MTDTRLIEAGFPCHQVGAETQRERGALTALPPIYYLHVWWARRPLIPSRAAIEGSLLASTTDINDFLCSLGIERKVTFIDDVIWVLDEKILKKVYKEGHTEWLDVDSGIEKSLISENKFRAEQSELIEKLISKDSKLNNSSVIETWKSLTNPLPALKKERLEVKTVSADPAWFKELMEIGGKHKIRIPNLYGYDRAYKRDVSPTPTEFTVLDPTSGGGSIPYEALRSGHNVIANELNPVAATILHSTIEYPAKFGPELAKYISLYGEKIKQVVEDKVSSLYSSVQELSDNLWREYEEQLSRDDFDLIKNEYIGTYLYCRQVTCPHCGGDAPLFNSTCLAKGKEPWGLEIKTHPNKTVSFSPYRVQNGVGPDGQNPEASTVKKGLGQCVHCHQAIDSNEVKSQAKSESVHGKWKERLFGVVAYRYEPQFKNGRLEFYSSGPQKGQLKTKRVRYFRAPNEIDLLAEENSGKYLEENWFEWDLEGLIPTEKFPEGEDKRPINYGMSRWCDMFTPRQLIAHVTQIEALNALKPQILNALGEEQGKAVVTYLQFAIDKTLDYNSKQTRWEYTRGTIKGTFGRHDFSLKWTFGEMVMVGVNSGVTWGISQVVKAYTELAQQLKHVKNCHRGNVPVKVINGSGSNMVSVDSQSVDLVCFDPPYYDNVQYAELSDYFYVWQKRTLSDLYPGYFNRSLTDKSQEAVANRTRDGKEAYSIYEQRMSGIFSECLRVLKSNGVMTLMFTHKAQDAWEALTNSLIQTGWVITSSIPVESESKYSTHQKDMAAAASSIFITCRKAERDDDHSSFWRLGQNPVQKQIGDEVVKALAEFEALKLNPVDRMVASYGRALKVLSENWPVMDEGEQVTPARAMQEAAQVVARNEVSRITQGRIAVEDLDAETAMAVMALGLWGHSDFDYDDALNLTRSLKVTMESKSAGYRPGESMVGYNTEERRRGAAQVARDVDGWHAPLVRKGSKLRLAGLNERSSQRLQNPVTLWDILHGTLAAYEEGGIVQARNYLTSKADDKVHLVRGLLAVWAEEVDSEKLKEQAESLLFELND
ncbi:hypothetical protein XM68_c11034 [Vibrio alginolyticus]|uniref:DUF1156 domain-containing protein n=1 Tax=Vibrio alginolyticus TaxID=663 RepID=UPI0007A99FB2|nr:DUF1156 domain-containing protein [Vibrio alginolyticus]KZC47699.1 hypothetical protein XM68_c11034 [Vibrio alginolyticus]